MSNHTERGNEQKTGVGWGGNIGMKWNCGSIGNRMCGSP